MKTLQKMFPHDRVIQRMIEEEFSKNQLFRYPEEYDLFDQSREKTLKMSSLKQAIKKPDFDSEKTAIENFRKNDGYFKREAEKM